MTIRLRDRNRLFGTQGSNTPGDGDSSHAPSMAEKYPIRLLRPVAHQRLQFPEECCDNADAIAHEAGAYPCARNHSMAARRAGYTGTIRKPSSRSAFAEDANIFFFPIRTASTVARGSLPRSLPVNNSSKNANAIATRCGTSIVGEGMPVIADILSRI